MTGDVESYLVHLAAPDPGVMLPLHHGPPGLPRCLPPRARPSLSSGGPSCPTVVRNPEPGRGV